MSKLNTAGEKINLVDYTWEELAAFPGKEEIKFILPLGAIEEHGYHLPLGTDSFQAVRIAEMAAQKVPGTIVLPAMNYGFCVDTMNYCGTISASAQTICSMVSDIAESLYRHGFRTLVVFNSHGGNKGVADTAIRQALLHLNTPGRPLEDNFNLYVLNSFERTGQEIKTMLEGRDYGHACEMETSVMLALAPDMVNMKRAVEEYMTGDSYTVWRLRDMKKVSGSGVHGAANKANVEKGKKIVALLVEDLVNLLKRI